MNLSSRLKLITSVLVLSLLFYSLVPLQVLATPYGGCVYGGDSQTEDCLKSGNSINISQPTNQSFLDQYGWILFGGLFLLCLLLFILLLAAVRKKKSDGQRQPKLPINSKNKP